MRDLIREIQFTQAANVKLLQEESGLIDTNLQDTEGEVGRAGEKQLSPARPNSTSVSCRLVSINLLSSCDSLTLAAWVYQVSLIKSFLWSLPPSMRIVDLVQSL